MSILNQNKLSIFGFIESLASGIRKIIKYGNPVIEIIVMIKTATKSV